MKRGFLIGIAAISCAVVAVVFSLSYYRRCYFATPAKAYATLSQAIKEGVIANGWLPDLPPTAYNIWEKHDVSHNTVIGAFSFDPSQAVQILRNGEEVSKDYLKTVRPSVICKVETWFPKAVTDGKWEELSPTGFVLYRVPKKQPNGISHVRNVNRYWYFLVHPKAGICYLWLN